MSVLQPHISLCPTFMPIIYSASPSALVIHHQSSSPHHLAPHSVAKPHLVRSPCQVCQCDMVCPVPVALLRILLLLSLSFMSRVEVVSMVLAVSAAWLKLQLLLLASVLSLSKCHGA